MKLLDTIKSAADQLWDTIVELFATHPDVDTFHKTSDDQFFEQKHHADAHAGSLPNKGVATITRDAVEAKQIALADSANDLATGGSVVIPGATVPTAEEIEIKRLADEAANKALTVVLSAVNAGSAIVADDAVPTKTATEIALETPEAERTTAQKGLVTKANKAKEGATN